MADRTGAKDAEEQAGATDLEEARQYTVVKSSMIIVERKCAILGIIQPVAIAVLAATPAMAAHVLYGLWGRFLAAGPKTACNLLKALRTLTHTVQSAEL
jgi:hypothetical protein